MKKVEDIYAHGEEEKRREWVEERRRERGERKMKIYEERKSGKGNDEKRNVIVCSDFWDSYLLIWDFFTDDFTNGQLNINICFFFWCLHL